MSHPRQLDLERLAAGERTDAAAHVESCAACRAVVEELRADTAAFVARVPARVLHEKVAARRHAWWRAWWPAALVPLAAAVALVVLTPGADEVRLKGVGLTVRVLRDGVSTELDGAGHVRPGDALHFTWAAREAGYLLLLDVERGHAPVVLAASPQLAAKTSWTAPLAFELDDTAADEWLVAIFSPTPVTPEVLTVPAGEAPQVSCPDCRVEVRRLERER